MAGTLTETHANLAIIRRQVVDDIASVKAAVATIMDAGGRLKAASGLMAAECGTEYADLLDTRETGEWDVFAGVLGGALLTFAPAILSLTGQTPQWLAGKLGVTVDEVMAACQRS